MKTPPKKMKKRPSVKTYATGRVCKQAGCRQRLSIYNSQEFCNVHHMENLRK